MAEVTAPSTSAIDVDLPQPLTILTFPPGNEDKETMYYILGTAHVSRSSCDDAAALIQKIKPDVVMLELCLERQPILSGFKLKEPSLSEVLAEIRSGRATPFQATYGWLLARVGDGLDVMYD
jgi:pheromone shutdown protein TraB